MPPGPGESRSTRYRRIAETVKANERAREQAEQAEAFSYVNRTWVAVLRDVQMAREIVREAGAQSLVRF